MSHEITVGSILPPIVIMLFTGILSYTFIRKRRETTVHALDWMIMLFTSIFVMGIFQVLKLFFHNSIFFSNEGEPLATDLVTLTHLIVLFILYFMVESFVSEQPSLIRLFPLSVLTTLFFAISIEYNLTGEMIKTSRILSFANDTPLDAFIFNIIQIFVLTLVLYSFYMQHQYSQNRTIRHYLKILISAIVLFYIMAIFELLEHILDVPKVSAFIFALPTFVILAWFYLSNSNFIYLTPVNIAFIQVVTTSGQLLYAAELTDELSTSDFLVAPSLTSVGSIISELVNKDQKELILQKFVYDGGFIYFEQVGDLRLILQSDRGSQMLKRSMKYFLREFNKLYADQIENYRGYITENNGVGPDDLLTKAIPIIQSKTLISVNEFEE